MFYYLYRWSYTRVLCIIIIICRVYLILFSLLSYVITCAITGLCLRQPYQHLFFLPRSDRQRVIIKCIIFILFDIKKKNKNKKRIFICWI